MLQNELLAHCEGGHHTIAIVPIAINKLMSKFVIYIYIYTHNCHDDAIKWKHFPRYWPFVRGRGALIFSLICAWINNWVNNGKAGDLKRHPSHYDVTVMAIKPKQNTRACAYFVYSTLISPLNNANMHQYGKKKSFNFIWYSIIESIINLWSKIYKSK